MRPIPLFINALTLLFIALKLTEHINWHWLWVCSPTLAMVVIYYIACAVEYVAVRQVFKHGTFLEKLELIQQGYKDPFKRK